MCCGRCVRPRRRGGEWGDNVRRIGRCTDVTEAKGRDFSRPFRACGLSRGVLAMHLHPTTKHTVNQRQGADGESRILTGFRPAHCGYAASTSCWFIARALGPLTRKGRDFSRPFVTNRHPSQSELNFDQTVRRVNARVRMRRLELLRVCAQHFARVPRLPVPPHPRCAAGMRTMERRGCCSRRIEMHTGTRRRELCPASLWRRQSSRLHP